MHKSRSLRSSAGSSFERQLLQPRLDTPRVWADLKSLLNNKKSAVQLQRESTSKTYRCPSDPYTSSLTNRPCVSLKYRSKLSLLVDNPHHPQPLPWRKIISVLHKTNLLSSSIASHRSVSPVRYQTAGHGLKQTTCSAVKLGKFVECITKIIFRMA